MSNLYPIIEFRDEKSVLENVLADNALSHFRAKLSSKAHVKDKTATAFELDYIIDLHGGLRSRNHTVQ